MALWNSGPSGLKALLEAIKAGATYLAQRAEYYARLAAEKGSVLAHQAGPPCKGRREKRKKNS